MITARLYNNQVQSNSVEAYSLCAKSLFGEKDDELVIYMPCEALYLMQEKKLSLVKGKKNLSYSEALKELRKIDKKVSLTYPVYRDLRKKGYILKTGLKFGGDFRVYKAGEKPGKTHSAWIVSCQKENEKVMWSDFSAKSRVANSTRKKLLLALVDQENSPNYYEISWTRI